MVRRHRLRAAIVGSALLATTAALGHTSLAGATTEPPEGTAAPDTAATDTAAGESGSDFDFSAYAGETVTYVYFTDGAPDEEATRAAIATFTEETGVEVDLQIVPFADLETTLQAQLSGGDVPDVARVSNWRPFVGDVVDMNEMFGADYSDQFLAGQVATALGDNGEFLAVPSDITMNGPFINVDAFNEAGVEIPTEWTWDELIEAAKQVQEANDMEFAVAIDKSGHRVSTVLSQFGTTLLGPDGVTLDPAMAEAAITTLTDLMAEDAMSADFWLESGSRYAGANEMFLAEAVPVYISGNWQVGQFAENAAFEWAAVPNPCAERCGGFPGGKYMVAFSGSDNPELAAAFVEWMNRTENQQQISEGASWLPTRNDLIESGLTYTSRSEDMAVFLADIAATPDDTYLSLASPAFNAAATAVVEEIALVVAGEEDVPTAVENIIARSEQGLEDAS
jgi:alpha-1,4-digalacturonate transport system substrate-binding protein